MKNMFNEEVKPRELSFKWIFPHLGVLVDGQYQGQVSPNGWQGFACSVQHPIGAPVMSNTHLWFDMSLTEMHQIIDEWNRKITPKRSMNIVLTAIAKHKKLTVKETVLFLKEGKHRLYSDVSA